MVTVSNPGILPQSFLEFYVGRQAIQPSLGARLPPCTSPSAGKAVPLPSLGFLGTDSLSFIPGQFLAGKVSGLLRIDCVCTEEVMCSSQDGA